MTSTSNTSELVAPTLAQSHKAGVTECASPYARRKSRCDNTILHHGARDPVCGPGVAFP